MATPGRVLGARGMLAGMCLTLTLAACAAQQATAAGEGRNADAMNGAGESAGNGAGASELNGAQEASAVSAAGNGAGAQQVVEPAVDDAMGERDDAMTQQQVPGAASGAQLSAGSDGVRVLRVGDQTLEVDTSRGARVVAFSHAGRNVLQPVAQSNGFLNGGSTLWTSPQSMWSWPPLPAHDEAPYSAVVDGNMLIAEGDPAALGDTEVALIKRFAASPAGRQLALTYTLRNVGTGEVSLAPWEVSRHPTGGLTFWPGEGTRGDFSAERIGAHQWLSYAQAWSGTDGKLLADGSAGWLAHVQADLLVVRSWDDVLADAQAPGEAEIEIYFAAGYVELEVQGPYRAIGPNGGEQVFTVRWQVLPIPPGTDVSPGSAALLGLVEGALP